MPISETTGALDKLASRSPALLAVLDELRAEWAPESPPATIAMGALGRALVESVNEIADDDLIGMASDVEDFLVRGSESTKAAVATGFLEAAIEATDSRPEAVRFWRKLGPRAREHCRKWDEFCGCRTPGVWDKSEGGG